MQFYEWAQRDGKQPYLFRLKDDDIMGMGGLIECWQGLDSKVMIFTLLTTSANPLISAIHERMPVIIKAEDYAAWLDITLTDILKIQAMAQPFPERLMQTYPVSYNVNNPLHVSPDLILPVYETVKFNAHSIFSSQH